MKYFETDAKHGVNIREMFESLAFDIIDTNEPYKLDRYKRIERNFIQNASQRYYNRHQHLKLPQTLATTTTLTTTPTTAITTNNNMKKKPPRQRYTRPKLTFNLNNDEMKSVKIEESAFSMFKIKSPHKKIVIGGGKNKDYNQNSDECCIIN
jgi:hypothetical protein